MRHSLRRGGGGTGRCRHGRGGGGLKAAEVDGPDVAAADATRELEVARAEQRRGVVDAKRITSRAASLAWCGRDDADDGEGVGGGEHDATGGQQPVIPRQRRRHRQHREESCCLPANTDAAGTAATIVTHSSASSCCRWRTGSGVTKLGVLALVRRGFVLRFK